MTGSPRIAAVRPIPSSPSVIESSTVTITIDKPRRQQQRQQRQQRQQQQQQQQQQQPKSVPWVTPPTPSMAGHDDEGSGGSDGGAIASPPPPPLSPDRVLYHDNDEAIWTEEVEVTQHLPPPSQRSRPKTGNGVSPPSSQASPRTEGAQCKNNGEDGLGLGERDPQRHGGLRRQLSRQQRGSFMRRISFGGSARRLGASKSPPASPASSSRKHPSREDREKRSPSSSHSVGSPSFLVPHPPKTAATTHQHSYVDASSGRRVSSHTVVEPRNQDDVSISVITRSSSGPSSSSGRRDSPPPNSANASTTMTVTTASLSEDTGEDQRSRSSGGGGADAEERSLTDCFYRMVTHLTAPGDEEEEEDGPAGSDPARGRAMSDGCARRVAPSVRTGRTRSEGRGSGKRQPSGGKSESTCSSPIGSSFDLQRTCSPAHFLYSSRSFSSSNLSLSGYNSDSSQAPPKKKKHGYIPYFDKKDFSQQNWVEVVTDMEKGVPIAAGIAVVATATVIVHPLVLIAGAATATAVWAVGTFYGVEHGYEFFSDGSFSRLFWDENPDADSALLITDGDGSQRLTSDADVIAAQQERVRQAKVEAERLESARKALACVSEEEKEKDAEEVVTVVTPAEASPVVVVDSAPVVSETPVGTREDIGIVDAPVVAETQQQPPPRQGSNLSELSSENCLTSAPKIESICSSSTLDNSIHSREDMVRMHFPPLQTEVVRKIEFPGLHALEFFNVYFSDNAPYSLKEFQQKRGDIDIVFGAWEKAPGGTPCSFLMDREKENGLTLPTLPSNARIQQRTLNFKTLTKSYFGPAYATATKTQRCTKLSKKLIVLENRTKLSDIPFGDRFEVVDRWVVESVRQDGAGGKVAKGAPDKIGGAKKRKKRRNGAMSCSSSGEPATVVPPGVLYTSRLTVHVEVKMLRSCTWEYQIRKKTLSTVTDLVTSWCKKATAALKLTEQKKLERLRREAEMEEEKAASVVEDGGGGEESTDIAPSCEQQEPPSKRANSSAGGDSSQPAGRSCTQQPQPDNKEMELMALHLTKFRELQQKIASGDLEWCSIEVQHSLAAGKKSAYAKVLNPYVDGTQHGGRRGSGNRRERREVVTTQQPRYRAEAERTIKKEERVVSNTTERTIRKEERVVSKRSSTRCPSDEKDPALSVGGGNRGNSTPSPSPPAKSSLSSPKKKRGKGRGMLSMLKRK